MPHSIQRNGPRIFNIIKHSGIGINTDTDLIVDISESNNFPILLMQSVPKNGTVASYIPIVESGHIVISGMYTPVLDSYPVNYKV